MPAKNQKTKTKTQPKVDLPVAQGCKVELTYNKETVGVVMHLGISVSEIKFAGERLSRFIMNKHLKRIGHGYDK